MINVSGAFKQQLYADKRNYLEYIKITLLDGTILELNNQHIWQGSLSFEEAVSADNEFQIGAAIVGKCDFTINNIYGTFDEFDFTGATVLVKIGLVVGESNSYEDGGLIYDDDDSQLIEGDEGETGETAIGETGETSGDETDPTEEWINKGVYTVDTADYNDTYIKISCLDNMSKLDKKFVSTLAPSFPIHAGDLLDNIFTYCGVSYNLTAFSYGSTDIYSLGDSETTTCRDVVSWIAQIFGYFARCNSSGAIEIKWFNKSGLQSTMNGLDGGIFDDESQSTYVSGETADGGSFNPWNTGDVVDGGEFTGWANDVHYFSSTFSHSVSVDDVVITGVRILVKTGGTGGSEIATHMQGTTGYVVEISNNPIITESNVTAILNRLYNKLVDPNGTPLTFRKANLTVPSDPSIEAGDVGVYFDRKGNHHPILISRTTFSPGESQTIVSSAQTPARNSSERYGAETRSYVEMRKAVEVEKTAREQAIATLRTAVANANGMYYTVIEDSSTHAKTYYLHNKGPSGNTSSHLGLNQSNIVIKFSDAGIVLTNNYTESTPTWYGLDSNGNMLGNLLNIIGINADWIRTGTLTVGGVNNTNGIINVLDSSGVSFGGWNNSGISIKQRYANSEIGELDLNYSGLAIDADNSYFHVGRAGSDSTYGTFSGTYSRISYSGSIMYSELTPLELRMADRIDYDPDVTIEYYKLSRIKPGFLYIQENYDNHFIRFDNGTFYVKGNLTVTGTKPRLVETEDYSKRLLYAYETPTPMFGDVGDAVIGEDGACYISIDPVFAETVTLNQYQVFLQKYGEGDAYVAERHTGYFVVRGTADLEFGWEIKAKQRDYEMYRLDKESDNIDIKSLEYGALAQAHIEQINQEREAS